MRGTGPKEEKKGKGEKGRRVGFVRDVYAFEEENSY